MPVPTAAPALRTAAKAAVAAYLEPGGVPGLALAVTDRDRLLLALEVGRADVAGGMAVEATTLFEIGSIGKAFTAMAILQLADEGRLALDDPVVHHLPWFHVPRTGASITMHHLLSHTAGISAGIDGTPEATVQVWRLRDLRPGSTPGRRFHYSNVGYKTLGLVIEAVEDTPYREVIRRRVMAPAGMTASEPAITDDIRPRMAVGYGPARADRPWSRGDPLAPATWLTTGTADGSVAATATDLAAFARALMADRFGRVERMARPVPALGSYGYGYGLVERVVDGRAYRGHGGGMVGYLAGLQWDRDAGIGAVVLQNGMDGNPNALARRLVRQARAAGEGRDPRLEAAEGAGETEAEADVSTAGDGMASATSPIATPPSADQVAIVGTYQSYQPWTPLFRIEARTDGRCWVVFPTGGPDGFDDEEPLVPMARGWFRVGDDRLGPERLRFDTVVDGLARRAWLSGWDFYRADR